jgi:inorganic phosphate transporter, PiT family
MLEITILTVFLGLLFDYTNGFHDAANVVSTVIATRVLAPLSAIVMAAVLNTLGATQISGVAQTIASGLVEVEDTNQVVVLCALIAAIIWNIGTWYVGMPSSSSYALIGGLLGSSWMHKGSATILWDGVTRKVLFPMFLSPLVGFGIGFVVMRVIFHCVKEKSRDHSIFRHLQVGSACFVALAHGLNDAQKSMGIITLGLFAGGFLTSPEIPLWVILSCALVMGLGTASGGFRIIHTMGYSITSLEPSQGFAAECSASSVILAASFMGMPISSTHMIAGSITGVGTAKGVQAVQWTIPRKIILALALTLPGAGLVGALTYALVR